MAANIKTGKTRITRYCGRSYEVRPGETYGNKQVWTVFCEGIQISRYTPTRSKSVRVIHDHAVTTGTYPAFLCDGLNYQQLVTALLR